MIHIFDIGFHPSLRKVQGKISGVLEQGDGRIIYQIEYFDNGQKFVTTRLSYDMINIDEKQGSVE